MPSTIELGFFKISNQGPHANCIHKYCVGRGGELCITERMKRYLEANTRLHDDSSEKGNLHLLKHEKGSDWDYLEDVLKKRFEPELREEIKAFFSKSTSYRLRFAEHASWAQSYIEKIFNESKFLLYRSSVISEYKASWAGSDGMSPMIPYKGSLSPYRRSFRVLCQQTRQSSVDAIYRLYDLCGGNNGAQIQSKQITLNQYLRLLFALGHDWRKKDTSLSSISQFVSRFQFFETFTKEARSFLKQLSDEHFLGEGAFQSLNSLWDAYRQAAANLRLDEGLALVDHATVRSLNQQLEEAPHVPLSSNNRTLSQLRTVFSSPMSRKYSCNSIRNLPVVFKNNFEAVIHPFKHQKTTDRFFKRGRQSPFTTQDESLYDFAYASTKDYMKMICEIVQTGEFIKAHPSQFDASTCFTFQKSYKKAGSSNESRDYGVHIKSYVGGVSYLLTCFDQITKLKDS